ncbi:gamma-glutamyltransferase [Thiohalobacter sp. IOR34]|uniref:gamma-glutamyltransferase n=1 Tax=Thiohalobacter sp. IOR34 TaxID=3057176 RepID=UPI0025AF5807|nr:gamma-glutamyltransferase [Thiohalobacter sp. IOR34]WJW75752.1 gamma-glutamyltransferase [Thiohalobacter sp. IOR34]
MRQPRLFTAVLAGWLLLASLPLAAASPPRAAVASAHPLATRAGLEILAAGGNAFDAAVAVSAALAVVEPYSSGLGGGGFWLLHRARDGFEVMVDGRERAPLAARRNMFLDAEGRPVPGLSMDGPLAAGIPGEPAALAHIAARYGRLGLARDLAPAIRLAREGFAVDGHYRRLAGFRRDVLRRFPAAAARFLIAGEVPPEGHIIRQPDLARTLEALASRGHEGFYGGALARRLVEGVRAAGGIWTLRDLAEYRVVEREPLRGEYRGIRVTSAAPPSSGGVALITLLNILAGYDLAALDEAGRVHLLVEAMRRAYRDRAQYLGDPDFVDMPLERLTHPFYAAGLRAAIRLDRALPSSLLAPVAPPREGPHTTHFSILDTEGNRVAATLSINYPFGSGFLVPGTGVLLNDEMDDFSIKPGVPNVYGLVGAEANAIAPGKRMLSSMTPTFLDDGERLAILGTPGGSRIISMVLLATLEFAAGREPAAWVARPRFHHQYLPDAIQFEPGALAPALQRRLEAMGHRLRPLDAPYGNMQAVLWDRRNGRVLAASDPRGVGAARLAACRTQD